MAALIIELLEENDCCDSSSMDGVLMEKRRDNHTEKCDVQKCKMQIRTGGWWLYFKGQILTLVRLFASNDDCFFTPYHCVCMHPAITADCRAKEKRKSEQHCICCLVSLPVFHQRNAKHTCHSMQIWRMKVLKDSVCLDSSHLWVENVVQPVVVLLLFIL